MAARPTIFKIRTPYKKCRRCGHRVPNSHDTVCPECHVPAEAAERAMTGAMKWLAGALGVLVLLLALPKLHQVLLELADHLGRH